MPVALSVPHRRQQSEGDCLPTCIQMVLAYWNRERPLNELVRILGTHLQVGTPASRVLRLCESGLSILYRPAEYQEIRAWVEQGQPVIALVDTAELPYWPVRTAHAVVVVGADEDQVALHDPAFEQAPLLVGRADLELARDAVGGHVAVIGPEGQS